MSSEKDWRAEAVSYIVNKYHYDTYTASKIYNRALNRLEKMISNDFNLYFETYASIVFHDNFVKFDIKSEKLYNKSWEEITELSKEEFEHQYTNDKLKVLADKYIDVQAYLNMYNGGLITLQELNDLVQKFKETNSNYAKEGSD